MSGGATATAVIGAGGFIGNRVVEMLHADGWAVRPVVRRASSLALAARFALEGRVADAMDAGALAEALQGCEVVVHALAGDPATIRGAIAPLCRAAEEAGCRRIVYLSSAVVHGQAPPPDTVEETPLPAGQRLAYNLAKRDAERELFRLGGRGAVEVTALRPGIVFGPRSQWIGGLADALLEGRAGLVDGAEGLCNAIYVDNVVHAVKLAALAAAAPGRAFLIGDDETPTWREFHRRVAEPLGIALDDIPVLRFAPARPSLGDRVRALPQAPPVRAAIDRLPHPVREGLSAAWGATVTRPPAPPSGPRADLETALLHRAAHAPGWARARDLLGYAPRIAPAEAWRRTVAWLGFAGYPTAGR
jgi:nucleoside-diphosphate-sugar epimerase